MKKLLLILLSAIIALGLYSCSNDKSENIHYLDNKLIEGTWIAVNSTFHAIDGAYTIDSAVYIFKDNKATRRFYAHIRGLDTLKLEEDTFLGTYLINDSTIFYSIHAERNQIYKFKKNSGDSLFLRHPAETTLWESLKRLKE